MTAEQWLDDSPDIVRSCVVDVDGVPMSALLAEAPDPRAVIVAIHGGATKSAYFDCPGHPAASLLRVASAAGYTVLALDRPGHGTSRPHAAEMDAARRVELTYGAITGHLKGLPTGAGIFVWAHSVGCELAVRLAADEARGAELLGLEVSGTGLEYQAAAQEILGGHERNAPPAGVRKLLWEPAALYPPGMPGGSALASPTPPGEGAVIRSWPRRDFPSLAPAVAIPVHFTAAAHERIWRKDPDALRDIAALFTGSPRVVVDELAGGGHNLSLGHAARAYHLHVLSFVESCVVGRMHPDLPFS
ncbi:alpha/beta hydrolase [Gordonia sp. SL306]|uniref:alpha/beta hydrolase n=1 Tax=Gordonia sp. SL306 TaxID=2995145 RepID=UPI002D1E41D1|nr:alpha/beta hydrolase [Gordonia sp. SL306]